MFVVPDMMMRFPAYIVVIVVVIFYACSGSRPCSVYSEIKAEQKGKRKKYLKNERYALVN